MVGCFFVCEVVCGSWLVRGVVCGVCIDFEVSMADCVVRKAQSSGECGWSGTSAK